MLLKMSLSYTKKRANRAYTKKKQPAPSVPFFKHLSKILFVSSMLLTLLSFWIKPDFLLSFHNNLLLQSLGTLIVLIGFLLLQKSFSQLGENYSPLFDAHKPFTITTHGIYKLIRHPIYLFNLFVSFGLAVASGSFIVLTNASIGLGFVLYAIHLEEKHLTGAFPEYQEYKKGTWRFFPFIF